jgi:DNA repair exonuclease SbcCD nuclease subunit
VFDAHVDLMKESMVKMDELMKKVFGDIPVYSIIGNHETQNL